MIYSQNAAFDRPSSFITPVVRLGDVKLKSILGVTADHWERQRITSRMSRQGLSFAARLCFSHLGDELSLTLTAYAITSSRIYVPRHLSRRVSGVASVFCRSSTSSVLDSGSSSLRSGVERYFESLAQRLSCLDSSVARCANPSTSLHLCRCPHL